MDPVIVMGVAGCGKSSVAQAIAAALKMPLVEGDAFHPPCNQRKMTEGMPLDDADRAGWLDELAHQIGAHPHGVVMTCSALKRRYRDRLRRANASLRFVHLAISQETALSRVTARAAQHFFGPSLVASQFEALESPAGEPGVLEVDATQPLPVLAAQIAAWMQGDAS